HGLLEKTGKLKHFNARKYIAINEHIYNYLIENKISSKNNIKFIRCGIPVPETIPAKNLSRIKVIAASRFTYEKGLDLFIKAVNKLNPEIKKKADFYIAGEGELKSNLLNLNKETGANISFLGYVKDMYKLLSMSHIFVYPSRSGTEGFPAVITEAGANGLLVISSNFRGVESVISHKENGIIFKSEDYIDLSKKLSSAIDKYKSHSPLAENFYKRVTHWYSLELMIKKHIELYRECLER
ncbi:MAG TPA: glycosyltransferase family 4 protein, partial [Ignavibacteria bacterium]